MCLGRSLQMPKEVSVQVHSFYLFIYYLESEACASGAVCRCPSESVSKYIGAVKSSHYILTFQNLSGLREQKSEAIEKIGQLIAEVTV